MMKRTLIFVLLTILLLSACAPAQTLQPGGQTPPPTTGGAVESSLAAAAAKVVDDPCSIMPADLASELIPGASAPQPEEVDVPACIVSNGTSVLRILFSHTFATSFEPNPYAEFIPGLAEGGQLERLDPTSPGDVYLTVNLGKAPDGFLVFLTVEFAGHDGKEHKDDAIAVAQAIIALLS